jgi:hypothetical protein
VNDDQLFGPFKPSDPPEAPADAKRTRKKRGSRRAAAPATTAEKPPAAETARPKRTRKPRQPRAARYTLAEALEITAGLTPEDVALVNQIGAALSAQSKAARTRIATAIGRMFA